MDHVLMTSPHNVVSISNTQSRMPSDVVIRQVRIHDTHCVDHHNVVQVTKDVWTFSRWVVYRN
jgi:hypothetical protein